jgi:hypothetical protein
MKVAAAGDQTGLEQYQAGFQPLLYGIVAALVLTFLLKETGPAVMRNATEVQPGTLGWNDRHQAEKTPL